MSRPELTKARTFIFFLLASFFVSAFVVQPPDLHTSDFFSFWAGAQLTGSQLYDAAEAQKIQSAVSPQVMSKRFIRPPFYALIVWPLGKLPFYVAYVIWSVLNLLALFVFLRLWNARTEAYFAAAVFGPVWFSFGIGQDAPLMLLIVAAAARLIATSKPLIAGAILGLTAIKPHLFLFVPVLLVAQRRVRVLVGMALCGIALYAISAAVVGPKWPFVFVEAVLSNESTISPRIPGVAGFMQRMGIPSVALIPILAVVTGIVYWSVRRAECKPALAFILVAGVAFAPRALVYDTSLFLPFLLLGTGPGSVAIIGLASLSAATSASIFSELTSLYLCWLSRPRLGQRTAGESRSDATKAGAREMDLSVTATQDAAGRDVFAG